MLTRCDEMNQTIDSVSSETDIRIFIESNRSLN